MDSIAERPPTGSQPGSGTTFSSRQLGLLAAITLLGAAIRIVYQLERSFVDDDVGTIKYLGRGYGYLLTHFDTWLTMNYFMALQKALRSLFGASAWVIVAPSLLAGIALVPLTARLALRFLEEKHALLVALLVAVNPFLVQYSASIRSYMPLVAFSVATLLATYGWIERRSWGAGMACSVLALLAVLVHPNAVYTLGFVGIVFLLALRADRSRLLSFAAPMAAAGLVALLAYAPLLGDMRSVQASWTMPPPTDWAYVPEVARRWFGTGWSAVPTLVLGAVGAGWALRNDARLATLALGVLVPMCLASVIGVSHLPGTYARFLVPALPLVIVFVVRGIESASLRSAPFGLVLAVVVIASWAPRLGNVFSEQSKKPYREIAAHLEAIGVEENEVFCLDGETRRTLATYLGKDPFTPLPRWLRRSRGDDLRLVVLVEGPPIDTEVSQQRFGSIQVLEYTGRDATAVVERFLADLEQTLAGKTPSGRLTDHAVTVLEILGTLDRERGLLRYTAFYYECLMRSKRVRDLPPQQVTKKKTLSGHPMMRRLLGLGGG